MDADQKWGGQTISSSKLRGVSSPATLGRFKKQCSQLSVENVFGETPNTAGEDARAPRNSTIFSATIFIETLQRQ
jgi:hypothetical protein